MAENTERDDFNNLYKLVFAEQSQQDLSDALDRRKNAMPEDEYFNQLNVRGTFLELVKRMIETHSEQTVFIRKALEKIIDPTKVGDGYTYVAAADDEQESGFELKNRVLQLEKSLKGVEVSGDQARMLILASNHNMKRLYLYSSGFNIVIRGPSLGEMNLVYNRLKDDMDEYGRVFGAMFYMYSDVKIKEILWDFISNLIVGSNLNKWDKGNRLKNNISFNDYAHILLGVASLMYKEGYDFIHPCTKCEYITEAKIDLNLLQLTDFSRIPLDALRALSVGSEVTPDDVSRYKKGLSLNTSFIIGKYKINRRVPSINEYLESGTTFNDKLAVAIHDINEPEIISQYLKFNYSLIFAPWITSIEILDAESTEVSFRFVEREAINIALSEIQNSDHRDEFVKQMNDYIQGSIITNIGYLATPCQCCNEMPSDTVNGFVPFDVQSSFFTILVMRLIQVD